MAACFVMAQKPTALEHCVYRVPEVRGCRHIMFLNILLTWLRKSIVANVFQSHEGFLPRIEVPRESPILRSETEEKRTKARLTPASNSLNELQPVNEKTIRRLPRSCNCLRHYPENRSEMRISFYLPDMHKMYSNSRLYHF
ncbi:hypothetical protein TcasGA2_TC000566 [Tribolium castaneum]|uniref:Uncharacterized protein n=1 Tax=Tribolium castaneum TaxID=7070 RepID=D6W9K1_TRICA|nr:hypothetical protein TcasGA2_TC000566 [Tribolium castaneum]